MCSGSPRRPRPPSSSGRRRGRGSRCSCRTRAPRPSRSRSCDRLQDRAELVGSIPSIAVSVAVPVADPDRQVVDSVAARADLQRVYGLVLKGARAGAAGVLRPEDRAVVVAAPNYELVEVVPAPGVGLADRGQAELLRAVVDAAHRAPPITTTRPSG